MEYTSRSQLIFEPGESAAFAVDAVATPYGTPSVHAARLKDLARLRYVEGSMIYRLSLSAADNTGVVDVEVRRGATVIGSETVTFNGASVYRGVFGLDLSDVVGGAPLTAHVVVTTAAAAAVTATLAASLDIEHPLVIGC